MASMPILTDIARGTDIANINIERGMQLFADTAPDALPDDTGRPICGAVNARDKASPLAH